MKIAYIYDAVYPFIKGGGERRIYELAKRLTNRGHEVSVLGMKCWQGPPSFRENGLRYRSISPFINPYHTSGRRSIVQALEFGGFAWRMLAEQKYDIIDCGQWPYFHLLPAKAYSLIRRTPFVVTWYEVWKEQWLDYLGSAGALGMFVEKTLCRFPDKIIAVSQKTRSDLVDIGAPRERVALIANGIDFVRIQSVRPGHVKTDLAYCGRLKNHKNVHVLIETIAILKHSRPGISAVIIGDGPESESLRMLASQLGVAENIIFTGALRDFDEVIGWLKASKVFVHPSTKEGGGSITLLEANASGLPVIAIDCQHGIDPALFRQGVNGYLVKLEPEEIARIALELLNSESDLRSKAVAARKFAADYDWDLMVQQHEQVYLSELSRRKPALP